MKAHRTTQTHNTQHTQHNLITNTQAVGDTHLLGPLCVLHPGVSSAVVQGDAVVWQPAPALTAFTPAVQTCTAFEIAALTQAARGCDMHGCNAACNAA